MLKLSQLWSLLSPSSTAMAKSRRWALSQNFLHNRELVNQLIRASSVTPHDHVLEIGPGTGIITRPLLSQAKAVTAVEIDPQLSLPPHPKLTLVHKNFLDFDLPKSSYKVFSNIPFNITGEIIKKLLLAANPPEDANLVVQNEAAAKFQISPHQNTMLATLFYPWFSLKIIHHFSPTDFYPIPKVRSCLLHIHRLQNPLIPLKLQTSYRDFIVWHYIHNPLAKFTPPHVWLRLFNARRKDYPGSYSSWLASQSKLQKIHRTRTDKFWKRLPRSSR